MRVHHFFSALLWAAVLLVGASCSHVRPAPERTAKKDPAVAESCSASSAESFVARLATNASWWHEIRCDLRRDDLQAAQEKLELVLGAHAGKAHPSEAVAVFFLSEIHFRRGDMKKFAAYLWDARSRESQLPGWMRDVELPLRAAQMELRLGAVKEYEALSQRASANLVTYQQRRLIPPEEFAAALFQLGHFRWHPKDNVKEFVEQIQLWKWSQKYLIQVLELPEQDLWPLASELIVENYKAISNNITSWPREIASDPALSAYRQQESQWEMIYHTLHVMQELKVLPLEPGEDSSWLLERVGELASVEKDLRDIYFQQPVGSELTPASQQRQRPLRTIHPEPVFEKSSDGDPNL